MWNKVYGGKMSYLNMRKEIARHLFFLYKFLYLWMHNIPSNWSNLIRFLTDYTLRIGCKVVYRRIPRMGGYKSDSTSKGNPGNPGPRSYSFYIRND